MERRVGSIGFLAVWLGLLLGAGPALGQERGRLTGRVVDAGTGRPLAGVQVFLPQLGIGNITDADGRYVLPSVPPGVHAVTAQLVGYRRADARVSVEPGRTAVANFSLTETAIQLEQIVVTGAGVATQKRKLGNTIATIDAAKLETAPITDFSQILQGREPGVVTLPSSGYAGEGARIRIRGSASLSQLNEPIVYVDGVRVDRSAATSNGGGTQGNPSRLDDIPPDAIERVEILKGAAAATLYGTEASNGVIQIFTKRGRSGPPRVTVQADWTAMDVPTGRMEPMADFAESQADIDRIQKRWGRTVQLFEPFEVNLLPRYFKTGFGHTYSVSVNGGGDRVTYYVSGRLLDENGPFAAADLFRPVPGLRQADDRVRRFQSTANLTVMPHEKVRVQLSTLYAELNHEVPDNANNIYGVFSSALMTQLRLAHENNLYGTPAFATLRENLQQQNTTEANHFKGSLNVNYTPVPKLRLDATFGVDFVNEDGLGFRPFRWNVDNFSSSTPEGTRTVDQRRNRELTADVKAAWEAQAGGSVASSLVVGTQGFLSQRERTGGTGTRFPGPGLAVAGAGADQSVFESWLRVTQIGVYVQEQLGWRDWAFLTLGGRWDANSAFGEKFKTAFYPKASLSLVPGTALGWQSRTLSTVRVRAAVGESGLQPGAFDKFTTFRPLPSAEGPGLQPDNLGNDRLRPEVSREWELGAELGFFEDRASLDVTFWKRRVRDALVERQFVVTGGFLQPQLDNIGELRSHGFEILARGNVYQSPNLSVSLFANGAFLREKITSMGGAPPIKIGGSYPRYRNFLVEGYAPGAFFGAEVARHLAIPLNLDGTCKEPTREQALAYFSRPRNPSEFKPLVIGNSDFGKPSGELASHNCGKGALLTYLGKPMPDWQGSFGFTVGFLRHFELNSLFEYKAGNFFVHDLSGEFRRSNPVIGRNTPKAARLEAIMRNPASTPEQRLEAAIEWARTMEGLSPLDGLNSIKPADFVRWRELSLTYRVPPAVAERFGLTSASFSLGARNLALWVNDAYPGMDPEANVYGRCNEGLDCNYLNSTEGWNVPIPRRITFSTRFTF